MAWNETTRGKYSRRSGRYESDLTDGEWAVIQPLLPPPSRLGRRTTTDLREASDAARYMLATGCQWRAIPKCFPPFTTVQNHFHAWRDSGVLERMLDALRALARAQAGRLQNLAHLTDNLATPDRWIRPHLTAAIRAKRAVPSGTVARVRFLPS